MSEEWHELGLGLQTDKLPGEYAPLARAAEEAGFAVVVDNGDRPEHDPDLWIADALAHHRHDLGIRATAHLQLLCGCTGKSRQPGRPGADEQRHGSPSNRVAQAIALREREPLALEAGVVLLEETANDFPRFANRRDRIGLVDAYRLEPGASSEAEEGATLARGVEHCRLTRDLDGVHGEGVETGRPDPDMSCRTRDLQERRQRRLKPEVVERGDDGEARLLGGAR